MHYPVPAPQVAQSVDPRDYAIRIIVAGSRNYSNLLEFHLEIVDFLARFDKPVLFISGAARTGADDLIIRWCAKFGYPCLQMPADWNAQPRSAGYIRNTEMAKQASHLLAFWDGASRGTQHMIDEATRRGLNVRTVNITL